MNLNEQKEYLQHDKKEVNLKDEILNAFQDLNNDFQQYSQVLNGNNTAQNQSNTSIHITERLLNKTMSKI